MKTIRAKQAIRHEQEIEASLTHYYVSPDDQIG